VALQSTLLLGILATRLGTEYIKLWCLCGTMAGVALVMLFTLFDQTKFRVNRIKEQPVSIKEDDGLIGVE